MTTAEINGIPLANGNLIFLSTFAAPDGTWSITYNLIADLSANPQTSLTGTVKVVNSSATTRNFKSGFSTPICPIITEGSLIGGAITLTLTAVGPGALGCFNGLPVVQIMQDDEPVASMFWCPFNLSTTGSGTVSSNNIYGLPGPSLPGAIVSSSIGEAQQYSLTAWDSATVQVSLLYKDANGQSLDSCPADLNGDFIVGVDDLGVVLQNWGQSSWCPQAQSGDVNGDGGVNTLDMLQVLDAWGLCTSST
ncbi:MAG: hypothetical protein SGJ11_08025 [Phycisphaerae bacterium]|nr:hypothetical protein [Phycisphaerae bacterium]